MPMKTIKSLSLFLLALFIAFISLYGTSKLLKTVFAGTGLHTENIFTNLCDPSGGVGTSILEFIPDYANQELDWNASMSTSRTGMDSCRTHWFLSDGTFDYTALDYLYIDIDVTVTSGTCYVGYALDSAWGQGVYTAYTTSTTTTQTINNSGGGYDSLTSFGLSLRLANSGASTCSGKITRVYDNNGNDYMLWYDTSAVSATTTIETIEYVPTNVVVTSTLCTEETSTTTGQATTTCTNTLSTTTAFTYSFDTSGLENIQNTMLLFIAWVLTFCVIFWVIIKFIKPKHGDY